MELKAFSREDLEPIYQFLSTLEPENGFENKFYGLTMEQFMEFGVPNIERDALGEDLAEGRVPQTLFFLWDHNQIVGMFKLRHYLNDTLIKGSGHIGYSIKKEFRRQGYASAGLGLLCKNYKQLIKEDEFYLSCLKTNEASYKAMLHNLGYLHHDDQTEHYVRIRKSILG